MDLFGCMEVFCSMRNGIIWLYGWSLSAILRAKGRSLKIDVCSLCVWKCLVCCYGLRWNGGSKTLSVINVNIGIKLLWIIWESWSTWIKNSLTQISLVKLKITIFLTINNQLASGLRPPASPLGHSITESHSVNLTQHTIITTPRLQSTYC
jgi:hypothetical protein